tara:strand:- start:492 stop:734 length:243 start_codon:yes stop_codon:yes gene_type:complete
LNTLLLTTLFLFSNGLFSNELPQKEQIDLSENTSATMLIATTASEHAATGPASFNPMLEDHYGNPDNFIQYIIRVPPVHA